MASMPPTTGPMGGPPPGSTPQGLSSMNVDPMSEDPEAGGGSAGLAQMFYAIEQQFDELAGIIPNEAESIDEIKGLLREILARAVSAGSDFTGSETRGPNVNGPVNEPMI